MKSNIKHLIIISKL